MVTIWGAYRKSPTGYSGYVSPTRYDHSFSQTGGSHLPVKTCTANCSQSAGRVVGFRYLLFSNVSTLVLTEFHAVL